MASNLPHIWGCALTCALQTSCPRGEATSLGMPVVPDALFLRHRVGFPEEMRSGV